MFRNDNRSDRTDDPGRSTERARTRSRSPFKEPASQEAAHSSRQRDRFGQDSSSVNGQTRRSRHGDYGVQMASRAIDGVAFNVPAESRSRIPAIPGSNSRAQELRPVPEPRPSRRTEGALGVQARLDTQMNPWLIDERGFEEMGLVGMRYHLQTLWGAIGADWTERILNEVSPSLLASYHHQLKRLYYDEAATRGEHFPREPRLVSRLWHLRQIFSRELEQPNEREEEIVIFLRDILSDIEKMRWFGLGPICPLELAVCMCKILLLRAHKSLPVDQPLINPPSVGDGAVKLVIEAVLNCRMAARAMIDFQNESRELQLARAQSGRRW